MVTNLEKKKEELERKMLNLAERIKAGDSDVQSLQRQIARFDVDYRRTIDTHEIKRESLRLAEEKLEELAQQKEDVKAERESEQAPEEIRRCTTPFSRVHTVTRSCEHRRETVFTSSADHVHTKFRRDYYCPLNFNLALPTR